MRTLERASMLVVLVVVVIVAAVAVVLTIGGVPHGYYWTVDR